MATLGRIRGRGPTPAEQSGWEGRGFEESEGFCTNTFRSDEKWPSILEGAPFTKNNVSFSKSFRYMVDYCDPFVLYKQYPSGGKILQMNGLKVSSSDYKDIMAIAKFLAKNGHEVKVLHAVHYKDPLYRKVYGDLIGTRYYRKCPDLFIDGCFYEYESYDRVLEEISKKYMYMKKERYDSYSKKSGREY